MLNWLGTVLQFVITWSQFIGLLTAPIVLVCLVISILRKSEGAATSALYLLWPWSVYVSSVGIALCISFFGTIGWFAAFALFALSAIFGVGAAWAGVMIAFISGERQLAAYLAAVCVGLLVLKFTVVWLIARSREPAHVEPLAT